LLRTFWKVIAREGINQPGNATAREFMGTHFEETVDDQVR
jgi:hypothetical protein